MVDAALELSDFEGLVAEDLGQVIGNEVFLVAAHAPLGFFALAALNTVAGAESQRALHNFQVRHIIAWRETSLHRPLAYHFE